MLCYAGPLRRYDTVDVTEAVDDASQSITLALQCFHSNAAAAAVMLELHFHFGDGTSVVAGGTDATWSAFDADAVYNAYGASEVSSCASLLLFFSISFFLLFSLFWVFSVFLLLFSFFFLY